MVSIRRRKLLGLCSGRNSSVATLPQVCEHEHIPENCLEKTKPVSVHSLPLNDGYKSKVEITLETANGSPDLSASSPSKEQFPEVKRRKRHRRKHLENQEPFNMRGVYYKNRKWQAAIKVDKKQIHLGTVGSKEEAARLYDRAAFMCGREPNFELSEEEKKELRNYKWDEFLAITRSAITNKSQRRMRQRKPENDDWEGQHEPNDFSAFEDDMLVP
ncbi:hypothetical protein CDL12_28892 [Handroanthus impetiginosus]|uniref:AP2/ERF domain-containing protein n=1 Tax=Handroanthus impetiginosus TaxID=429701 RepID=A0A2G9G0A6_9LAMI|nr:hypothetical protein CDL12_28892 [Handroanthus impetiginosus]